MNDMDKRVADDPTLTDAQKLQHKFGNAFQPLSVQIEMALEAMYGGVASDTTHFPDMLAKARDTYLDEMREMIERMGENRYCLTLTQGQRALVDDIIKAFEATRKVETSKDGVE